MRVKIETKMKQSKNLLLSIIIAALAALLLCAAPAAAAELAAGTPTANEETGIITVPVILKNDLPDFVGFAANVANNIPGVIITIGEERPITDAGYMVNSREKNTEQQINALFYDSEMANKGISDAEITLFTLNIKITDTKITNIPLSITLRELLSASQGDIPLDTVKQIDLSGLRLTETITADVKSEGKEDEIPVYIPPAPVLPEQTAQPAQPQTPTAKPVNAETAASPGFGAAAGILGLLLGAGLIRKYQNKR